MAETDAAKQTLAGILLDKPNTSEPAAPIEAPPPAQVKPRRVEGNVRLCSNCMGGPTGREFYVEQEGDSARMMLCTLRCLGLWALARGWPR
jgi:hypothetical protein